MIEVGDKKWTSLEDKDKTSYADSLLESSKSAREKFDFKWYMNYMFTDGNHYVYYNSTTNSLERRPREHDEVRLTVNKIKSAVRAVKNYSTRFEPKWEVIPGDTDEETITNARRSGKTLDYIYRTLHLEQVIAGLVDSALHTSVGWIELDWDENAADGMGQIVVRLHDPFDVWVDPEAQIYSGKIEGRYIIKTTKRSLAAVKSDERYDKKARKEVVADDSLAESKMKARKIRKERGPTHQDENERVTIKEVFLYDDEENDEGGHIRLVTYAGDQVLRDEDLPNKGFPLYCYQVPMDPLKIYHNPWVTDAIPLNKVLNRTISQKVMYVNQALHYRVIAEKGHGINRFTNEDGTFIEINPNRKFEQMPMAPLPQALDSLTMEINQFMEDILAAHEASTGRLPSGARSGKTLEALQAAESNNLAGIRQSLESFLSVVGMRILEIIADKYTASRVIKISEPEVVEGQPQNYISVIGESASQRPEGASVITGDNEVIVKIGSWLGYTREAQRETLLELAEIGAIPTEEVLRQFEFPNIEDLSAKARNQRLEEHEMQAEIAGRRGEGGQAPAGAGTEMQDLADKEMADMMNGNILPPTEGADITHVQAERDFMRSRTYQQAPEDVKANVEQHVLGEMEMLGLTGGR